jgi:hypothetical protein
MRGWLLGLLLGLAGVAKAGTPVEVLIDFVAQEHDKWCWAASAEAVLSADGRNIYDQCFIAGLSLGKPYEFCCKPQNFSECNRGFDPTIALRELSIPSMTVIRALTTGELRAQLAAGSPVIIAVQLDILTSHALVIYGLTKWDEMKIWDPASGGKKIEVTHAQLEKDYGPWFRTYVVTKRLRGAGESAKKVNLKTLREELEELLRNSTR